MQSTESANDLPKLDSNRLMSLVRHEVERRKRNFEPAQPSHGSFNNPVDKNSTTLPEIEKKDAASLDGDGNLKIEREYSVTQKAAPSPIRVVFDNPALAEFHSLDGDRKESYLIENLLGGSDEEFVRTIYKRLLRRQPDEVGLSYYLDRLKKGRHRVEILGAVYSSSESQHQKIEVRGLEKQYALQKASKWPVLGGVVRMLALPFLIPKANLYTHIETLSGYEDKEFVREAYLKILGRAPDTLGFAHYLKHLRMGAKKLSIIGDLLKSKEGRAANAYVGGYRCASFLNAATSVPVVGAWINFLFLMRKVVRDHEKTKFIERDISRVEKYVSEVSRDSYKKINELGGMFESAHNELLEFSVERENQGSGYLIKDIEASITNEMNSLKSNLGNLAGRDELNSRLLELAEKTEEVSRKFNHDIAGLYERLDRGLTDIAFQNKQGLDWLSQNKANFSEIDELKNKVSWHVSEIQGQVESIVADMADDFRSKMQLKASTADLLDLKKTIGNSLQNKALRSEMFELRTKLSKDVTAQGYRASRQINDFKSEIDTLIKSTISAMKDQAGSEKLESIRSISEAKISEATEALQSNLDHDIAELRQFINQAAEQSIKQGQLSSATQALDVRISENRSVISALKKQNDQLKIELLDQQRRVGLLLDEARKRLPEKISDEQIEAMTQVEDHALDAWYATFEDRFRGSRADILNRLSIYLPLVEKTMSSSRDPILIDLGCGRGEWLELLGQKNINAVGVDINRIFVDQCRQQNLTIVEGDALSHLRTLDANSVDVVTAFHFIEHLPHKTLMAILDEVLRVLRPNGVVILETPNPNNILVGSCSFYLDPTHRKPMPPELSQYLLEMRGFNDVFFKEIHPFDPEYFVKDGPQAIRTIINSYFFGARDYFVCGRKS